MPIFERPPLETLAPAKDRWTPLYLEHGRLEVDDASAKWIAKDGMLVRKLLKRNVEQCRMLQRMPDELKALFAGLGEPPEDTPPDHPLQPRSEA